MRRYRVTYHGRTYRRLLPKESFGIFQPVINGKYLDILFRMLQPGESAAAMGFPGDYQWPGTKGETIKMIGNAVEIRTAQAICTSLLSRASHSTTIFSRQGSFKSSMCPASALKSREAFYAWLNKVTLICLRVMELETELRARGCEEVDEICTPGNDIFD